MPKVRNYFRKYWRGLVFILLSISFFVFIFLFSDELIKNQWVIYPIAFTTICIGYTGSYTLKNRIIEWFKKRHNKMSNVNSQY